MILGGSKCEVLNRHLRFLYKIIVENVEEIINS